MSRSVFPALALVSALVALVTLATPAFAADDPSIRGDTRTGIQQAMTVFIAAQETEGVMRHYDPVAGTLRALRLEELHSGIVRKGDFYVSCADFVDADGTAVDIDFLVVPSGDGFRVNQALVHSVDGEKRRYHLESD